MINIAFASWHILLKNCVSDFWHMHLFFCDARIKSEVANHQHFLWKNDNYSKTGKRIQSKNPQHDLRKTIWQYKLAKFQLNRFKDCWLGVENVCLTFQNLCSEKTRKIYFLWHLTSNRIIMPNHLAITIGVWQVICSRPNLYAGRDNDLSQIPCFFHHWKCKISLVRQTAFVLPLEHPSETKFVNFPQVECFLHKSDKVPIHWSSPAVFHWLW